MFGTICSCSLGVGAICLNYSPSLCICSNVPMLMAPFLAKKEIALARFHLPPPPVPLQPTLHI